MARPPSLNRGTAKITVSLPETDNYEAAADKEIIINVAKADAPPVKPQSAMTVAYDIDKVSKVILPEDWTWSAADADKELIEGTPVTATAEYTAPDKDYFKDGFTQAIEITRQKKMRITIANAEVTGVTDKNYNGKAQTQKPVVRLAGKTLTEGLDYTISYANNINAGTATMTITGTGDYEGTKTVTFKILSAAQAKNLKNAMVTGLVDKTYTGKAITPKITVTFGGKKLKANTDYTVSYKNNTNAGTATITIKAKGKTYKGSKTVTFKINKAANPLKITGKTITFKEKELKKDKTLTVAQAYKLKKKGVGTISYKRASVNPATNKGSFTVDGKGKIKIKKNLKKGTYKVTVKVTAKGDKNHKSGTKTATVTIKVK